MFYFWKCFFASGSKKYTINMSMPKDRIIEIIVDLLDVKI